MENNLHWRLDVSMNEDRLRNRLGNGPENLAILRHLALNIIARDPSRGSLPKKLRRAALDQRFLVNLLTLS